jgi:flagellar biosynthesis protein FlhF
MQVKTYQGKSPEECFQKVKSELGLDAVILQSRAIQSKFGKFGPTRHEVVAAIDVTIPADKSPSGIEVRRPLSLSSGRIEPPAQPAARREAFAAVDDERYLRLEKQLTALTANMNALTQSAKNQVARGKGGASEGEPYAALYKHLLEGGVAEPLVKRMIAELSSGLTETAAAVEIRDVIVRQLKTAARFEITPGKTRLVAFLGGTGVGKTTTIAKIAAQLALKEKRSVGIISMDTHRVAAAQQLQTYGEILRVPVKVAYNKQEMRQYLIEFAAEKREVVLLDTAGRSPNDSLPLAEIAGSLEGISGVYTYLAVPATLSYKNFENAVEKFQSQIQPDALILTKMDESIDGACFGHLLNIQAKTGIPLTYITNGQRVPDDLLLADAHAIAARMMTPSAM